MKKATFLFGLAAIAVSLVSSPAAKAISPSLSLVTPGDTFSFDLVGFNTASGAGSFITPLETATFGATTTFTGAGIDGQNITITSSETIGITTTTDTFTVSTPTNFLTDTSLNGTLINGLQFDLGDANSGGNTVAVVLPIGTYTATGSTIYGTNTTAALTPTTQFPNGNTSYAAAEGVNSGDATVAINAFTVHSFTYSITYATVAVPEPSTWAMLGLGTIAGAVAIRRRRVEA